MEADTLIREYLLLGLRFDRIEDGYVDSFTGDPALRRAVADEPAPDPADLARQAQRLLAEVPRSGGLEQARADYLAAHLRALDCAGRKFAGEQVGFVDEVEAYFDVRIGKGDTTATRPPTPSSRRRCPATVGWPTGCRPTAPPTRSRRSGSRSASTRSPAHCATGCAPTSRCPTAETVNYEVVTDKPWSGFNYYLGDYTSTVAVNADLKQQMANLPRLVAHESYPGHHTEHCRKEAGLVAGQGQVEQTIFLVNTPQCLMAEGLADLALHAAIGQGWGAWASEIYADLGLRFDGHRAEAVSEATAALADVRQDAALMLHDEHRDADDVVDFLRHWLLVDDKRARQMLRFLSSPLWRAYTSTYVEGYRLLRGWLDARPADVSLTQRFGRLLDEPLIPSSLRAA